MPKNPHADFSPVLKGYSGQSPFKFWCQMALPLTYDDSLSYYELLNKVVSYLNNTISDVANVEDNVGSLLTSFTQLQDYVNTYFDELDIEQELKNILDEMALDGSLDTLLNPLVVSAVGAWLEDNLTPTTPPVDSTLSIQGAAADAKVTGKSIGDLKTQILKYGAFDVLLMLNHQSRTINGITYTWSNDNSSVTVDTGGNPSTGQGTSNFYNDTNNIPAFIIPGETYHVNYVSTDSHIGLQLYYYNEGSLISSVTINSSTDVTIPENTTGIIIRLSVSANITINNATASITMINTKSNKEITDILNDLTPLLETSFISHASTLANGTDIDSVLENGWYTLTSGYTYAHSPINSEGAMLFVYTGGNIPVQCMISTNTDARKFYTRSGRSGSFVNRDWVNMLPDTMFISHESILENGTDIDSVLESGWYTLTSNYIYTNSPINNEGAILFVYPGGNIPVQCMIGTNTGARKFYTRSGRSGSFVNRDWVNMLPDTMFISHESALANGTDIDSIIESGWYTLTSGYTYTHSPINNEGAILFVYPGGNIPVQCMISTNTGARKFYTRSGRSGSFVSREWVNMLPDTIPDAYKSGKKYVAFGDSLMWGAVWSPTQGSAMHQVKTEWRIPARIALATGMRENYINAAVSGYGYVYKGADGTNPNIPEQIAAYNFDDVELVTIMAGANDKLKSAIPLGTVNSVADDGSICGAIKSIIEYLQTNYPKLQLIIIQPTPSGTAPGNDVWTWRGAGGWSMNDFDTVVSELCRNNHVGYVNWNECPYCNNWTMYNIGYSGNTGPNYTHPVQDADYLYIGDFIAGKISTLFKGLA